jgi:hypothetical protein
MTKKFPVFILVFALGLAWPARGDSLGIRPGDSVQKVYRSLGTPTLEYPLNGELIQEYGYCTVFSRNGIVVKVVYQEGHAPQTSTTVQTFKPASVDSVIAQAEAGIAEAQYMLAFCYQSGHGMPRDDAMAIKWYIKAAAQNHMPSQHNLGVIYMQGKGVPKNYEKAYIWALLAEANGNATLKTALKNHLTSEQRLSAEVRADQIQISLQKDPETAHTLISSTFPEHPNGG